MVSKAKAMIFLIWNNDFNTLRFKDVSDNLQFCIFVEYSNKKQAMNLTFNSIHQYIKNTIAFFFIVAIVGGGGLSSCSPTQNISQNKWYAADSSIVLDGALDEWERPLKEPSNYTNIQYNVGNDAKNLYICVRIPDKDIQRRVMGLGLSIFVDTLAKRRDKIGIGFPLALTEEQIQTISFQAQKEGSGLDGRAFDQYYAKSCQEFELLGFVEEDVDEKIRVSNLASKDLKTVLGFDPIGAMICEYKIPLDILFDGTIEYDEVLSIGIRVNPPEANADNDPGLFDNTSNPITGNNQQQNPMMNGRNPNQQPVARQPSRSSNGNITGVWSKIKLTKN